MTCYTMFEDVNRFFFGAGQLTGGPMLYKMDRQDCCCLY